MLEESSKDDFGFGKTNSGDVPQRIAVVRALQGLGDFLCAVPSWRALRLAAPSAQIVLVGLPAVKPLVARFSQYLDGLLEFPGFPGIIERKFELATFPGFLQTAFQHHFDLAIQMHGSGLTSNLFTTMLGAQHTAGFYIPGQYCPDPVHFLPYLETEHEIHRYLRLVDTLGATDLSDEMEFPLNSQDEAELAAIPLVAELLTERFVCIHPGASTGERRWPLARFAEVARFLAGQGFKVVVTGSDAEFALARQLGEMLHLTYVNLAGQTTLGALAVLLTKARLLISNDTGVAHLAAALKVPSVVIFTASDPCRWGPLDRERHRVLATSTGNHYQGAASSLLASDLSKFEASAAGFGNPVQVTEVLLEVEQLLRKDLINAVR